MSGKVYLVGAGPGDPGLITLKGKKAIQEADVLVYDRLAPRQLLEYAKPGAERIYVGKLPDRHTMTQDEINQLLVEKAAAGSIVTRLKGGDPFIFGRGGEEAEALVAADLPFEVVPGITSAVAVPAYAGIPITHRDFNSSFAIVTGHERPEKESSSIHWASLATATETIVFLMGVKNLPYICQQLIDHGRDSQTPIALVRWGTRIEQETLVGTLGNIVEKVEKNNFRSPAVIIVGQVVQLREKLQWYEKKPLFGNRILVTRARTQASQLSDRIRELGGEPIEFPVIEMKESTDQAAIHDAMQKLSIFDWVVFTSVNGVQYFFDSLKRNQVDIRRMEKAQIAAIGPSTAQALQERGLLIDQLPSEYRAEALVEALQEKIKAGDQVLLPRANIARQYLVDALTKLNAEVTDLSIYQTEINTHYAKQIIQRLEQKEIDIITFTSSSTVHNFIQSLKDHLDNWRSCIAHASLVCIGPVTAQTLSEYGVKADAVAKTYTIDGLLETIQNDVQMGVVK
ncbi:uroporphyrinogen III methyltransferase / synthase [Seinonella peptonophila]|uniref:Uroporphyrinogen-III C-methyltransferase n=1 Tax=Seinonella peptonophila TaxID=112248 RepID=A0A1M4TUQ1_9BACL|nr:uroporphyrinogen-III C-methyltransferase [Seinonella peptonophila]SHE48135.1 uroporphyrinogen III methyltransferase / synthase [Seinonella peptonophila]